MLLKWELRVLHPDLQKAGKEEKDTELAMVFETSKTIPWDIIPNTRSQLLNPSQIVPKTGDQIFKHICLWGPFLF